MVKENKGKLIYSEDFDIVKIRKITAEDATLPERGLEKFKEKKAYRLEVRPYGGYVHFRFFGPRGPVADFKLSHVHTHEEIVFLHKNFLIDASASEGVIFECFKKTTEIAKSMLGYKEMITDVEKGSPEYSLLKRAGFKMPLGEKFRYAHDRLFFGRVKQIRRKIL